MQRWMWLALDQADAAVAFVDAEMYDRYAAWDGSDPDHPIVSDVVELPSLGITSVVDPSRRGQGFGTATLHAVVRDHDLAAVRLFFGSIDVDNAASIATFRRAGFLLRAAEPDFEGMLHYSFER